MPESNERGVPLAWIASLPLVASVALAQDVGAQKAGALENGAQKADALHARAETPATPRGLLRAEAGSAPGYTLVAPLRSTSTYLIDSRGETVHEWKSDLPPGQAAYLLPNGRLLRTERPENPVFMGGGQGGRLREYDWDGNVTWEYVLSDDKRCLHHDVKALPNGNVLAIVWEARTRDEAVAAGRDEATAQSGVWSDAVIEIEPVRPVGGKIVWEWHAFDHLVQDRDPKKPEYAPIASRPMRLDVNAGEEARQSPADAAQERERLRGIGYVGGGDDGRPRARRGPGGMGGPNGMGGPGGGADWTHANGLDWHSDLDVIVLSSRSLSEIWVIDHGTTTAEARTSAGGKYGHGGDLLFRFGNPATFGTKLGAATGDAPSATRELFFQHDPQFVPGSARVLVFNNGGRGREDSSVDEWDLGLDVERLKKGFDVGALATAKRVWTYTAPEIRSSHISGAQRLANGNTLIGSGEAGLVREVTAQGAVVWDWSSTLAGTLQMGGPRGGRGPRPPADGADGGAPPPPGGGDTAPLPGGRETDRGPRPGDGGGPRGGGRGGRGPGGPGGPDSPYSFFRVDRYAPDHPALRPLQEKTGSGETR